MALLCAGIVVGFQSRADEGQPANMTDTASQTPPAMPPQSVTDGGVEAVREAQTSAPAPVEKFKEAKTVLQEQARKRGWQEGWDDKTKRIIVIADAEFKTTDPAKDADFFRKREMAAKKAILTAKAEIIQTINQDMSAMDMANTPGTDVNKQLGAEREKLNAELAQQKEVLVALLERVDKAAADVLRGTTFDDRLNDLMVAAIKKLDAEYEPNARDQKALARYKAVKADFNVALEKYKELEAKAESIQAKVRERQDSMVASMAKMPLYGASVIMQTESWDNKTGRYQVALLLCWSYALERSARAIVTGEDFHVKPSSDAQSIHDWLEMQELAVMVGPRQYIDKDGNRWFLGITARPYDDELSSTERSKNKAISGLFAQQMAAFCLWADVESYRSAQQALESRGDAKEQRDEVAESYAAKLTQSFSNKKIRGMQRLVSEEATHPITGNTIYVTVYGINAAAAKGMLEVEKINYATKIMDNQHQTVERGRDAANRDAVRASENRQQDFQKGYSEQSGKVNEELQKRDAAAKGTNIINNGSSSSDQPRHSTSGTFGGDTNVSDDF